MLRNSFSLLLMFAIMGCGNKTTSTPPPPSSTPEATQAAAVNSSTTATTETSTPKTYTYDQIKLVAGDGIAINNEMKFGNRFANEPKYMNLFKVSHTDMNTQMLAIDGQQMQITYAGFADAATASQALANIKTSSTGNVVYTGIGNYVVIIQTVAKNDQLPQLAQKAIDQIYANANK